MSLGVFSEIWTAMIAAFGTPWLGLAFIAMVTIGLLAVVTRLPPLIAVFMGSMPFFILLIYNMSLGHPLAIVVGVLVFGVLLTFSLAKILLR